MLWILLSLGSTVTFALVSALDKVLIERFVPNPRTFITLVGLVQFAMALGALTVSEPLAYTLEDTGLAYLSGLVAGLYLVLMFWVMRTQDVSRVVPITSTYPIFVAALALAFLDERLAALAWVGIVATVAGAALMSFGPTTRQSERGASQILPFALLTISSLAFGLSQFVSKVVVDEMDIWTLFMWRGAGLGTACVGLTIRPSMMRNLVATIRTPAAMGLTLLTEGALVMVAVLFQLWAIFYGSVTLVSTVMATRSLFVFGLGILLSLGAARMLNEPLEGRILVTKLIAIAMTVGGVIAITLA